jgi:hypothetical protein
LLHGCLPVECSQLLVATQHPSTSSGTPVRLRLGSTPLTRRRGDPVHPRPESSSTTGPRKQGPGRYGLVVPPLVRPALGSADRLGARQPLSTPAVRSARGVEAGQTLLPAGLQQQRRTHSSPCPRLDSYNTRRRHTAIGGHPRSADCHQRPTRVHLAVASRTRALMPVESLSGQSVAGDRVTAPSAARQAQPYLAS